MGNRAGSQWVRGGGGVQGAGLCQAGGTAEEGGVKGAPAKWQLRGRAGYMDLCKLSSNQRMGGGGDQCHALSFD